MEAITVALFRDRTEADLLKSRLTQIGIPAEIRDAPGLARFWFVSKSASCVHLVVPIGRADWATRQLRYWDVAEGSLRGAIRCPECNSLRVDFPQLTRKSLITNLAIGLVAGLGLVEKEYYCEDCHCMWEKNGKQARRLRQHMAPRYFLD